MTLEQLRIFIAVAERQHVTRAARILNVSQSAASGAVAALEAKYDVQLFHRVGRGIELTDAGRIFLTEARGVLARAASAELALLEHAGLKRGHLRLVASQTIAGYWLPERLASFHRLHPMVELSVAIANTEGAARLVHDGEAELGFVEGDIDDPALAHRQVGTDRMLLVGVKNQEPATTEWLRAAPWIMLEPGSGTRSTFEHAIAVRGIEPAHLNVVLTLPSNEAVLAAVRAGVGYAVLSELVVNAFISAGTLSASPFEMPPRAFHAVRQKERHRSRAADAMLELISTYDLVTAARA